MIMISLDYQNRMPIYEQIVNQIERYVALGILKPKDQIPSIRELAGELGINPNTVKKSYDFLEQKGIITTISTKGTFIEEDIDSVIHQKKESLLNEISIMVEEYRKLGGSIKELEKILKIK